MKGGTRTVFGEGLKKANLMLVDEQPGDMEDLAGKPFVGPAGRLLDRALGEARIAFTHPRSSARATRNESERSRRLSPTSRAWEMRCED